MKRFKYITYLSTKERDLIARTKKFRKKNLEKAFRMIKGVLIEIKYDSVFNSFTFLTNKPVLGSMKIIRE